MSPTPRLVAGLVATLATVSGFALYSLRQLDGLRQLQNHTINRNRADSLRLLRVQNTLNDIGAALARMAGDHPNQGSWKPEFASLRSKLQTAAADGDLGSKLTNQLRGFWALVDQAVGMDERGEDERARKLILGQLEAHYHHVITDVGFLLVEKQRSQERAAREVTAIHAGVERNVYVFSGLMLLMLTAGGFLLMHDIRSLFLRVENLAEQRSTLAKKLIGVQEEIFRSVARELHDDFGQILTAVGSMMQHIEKRHSKHCEYIHGDMFELRQMVQEALEKARDFSQALHPTLLDHYGLEHAIDRYLPAFERQTGISVRLEKDGTATVPDEKAIHVYRVLQEALTNVARHSHAKEAVVRLRLNGRNLGLEVEDDGVGMGGSARRGLGLVAMRERAELVHGDFAVTSAPSGGTLVQLKIPLEEGDE